MISFNNDIMRYCKVLKHDCDCTVEKKTIFFSFHVGRQSKQGQYWSTERRAVLTPHACCAHKSSWFPEWPGLALTLEGKLWICGKIKSLPYGHSAWFRAGTWTCLSIWTAWPNQRATERMPFFLREIHTYICKCACMCTYICVHMHMYVYAHTCVSSWREVLRFCVFKSLNWR